MPADAGWALGAVLFPFAMESAAELETLLLLQAIGVSICFLLFVLVYDQQGAEPHGAQI